MCAWPTVNEWFTLAAEMSDPLFRCSDRFSRIINKKKRNRPVTYYSTAEGKIKQVAIGMGAFAANVIIGSVTGHAIWKHMDLCSRR